MIHGVDDILMLDVPGEPNRRTQYLKEARTSPIWGSDSHIRGGGTTGGKDDCTEERRWSLFRYRDVKVWLG
jgi:hypothetical protein